MSVGLMSGAAAGAHLATITISDQTLIGSTGSGQCSAGIKVGRDGKYYAGSSNSSLNPTYSDVGGNEWTNRETATVGDHYQSYFEVLTGALTSGTPDTWETVSTDREYKVSANYIGVAGATGTLKIRRVGTTPVLDTAAIQLSALAI